MCFFVYGNGEKEPKNEKNVQMWVEHRAQWAKRLEGMHNGELVGLNHLGFVSGHLESDGSSLYHFPPNFINFNCLLRESTRLILRRISLVFVTCFSFFVPFHCLSLFHDFLIYNHRTFKCHMPVTTRADNM